MVVPLGPGKFYGSSLPRPRIYTDVKFNDERVDPPVPVLDPLISWAHEAHWSMGGLSFKRLRLQGRIEGNVNKLRIQREKFLKNHRIQTPLTKQQIATSPDSKNSSPSPPPAPIATKRRRYMALIDEEDDDNEVVVRKMPARKLGDDFDRVATESGLGKTKGSPVKSPRGGSETVSSRTRSRNTEKEIDDAVKVVEDVSKSNPKGKKLRRVGEKEKAKRVAESGSSTPAGGARTSPRLAKRGSS